MRIHHLNCATMCPLVGGCYVNERKMLVCHVLLVETSDGLALVDTGLGEDDVPGGRGALYTPKLRLMGARLQAHETARQLVLFGTARGVFSAAVRLGLVGSYEAQRLQFEAVPWLEEQCARSAALDERDLAQTAPIADLLQSAHDRLYSRLFQS